LTLSSKSSPLNLQPSIKSHLSVDNKTFVFLNLSYTFKNNIDWNYTKYGKLWTYNLTYFDYLHQKNMRKEKGLELIYDFILQAENHKDALEAFPISLRGINWVKFLTLHQIKDKKIDDNLYAQYKILMRTLEYHLLGNHLLENGFSLLFAAYYFQDTKFYTKAKKILVAELPKQILDDGAHFELSPMYHQIMLFRILDCINLVKHNSYQDKELLKLLETYASLMLGWLKKITYHNGDIPLLNDSAKRIAPTSNELFEYAKSLNLNMKNIKLTKSGYRKIVKERYECVVDIGHVGAAYIPGHAHADTFNFELRLEGKPFIVDTGLSTYETNTRRKEERSTTAHNTVEINNTSSSEIWGSFRMADRAYVKEIKESAHSIIATHDGYLKKFGILHTRAWKFEEKAVVIKDLLNKTANGIARIHFHPDVTEEMIKKHILINQHLQTTNYASQIINYQYAPEFNKIFDAKVLEIKFKNKLEVEIVL